MAQAKQVNGKVMKIWNPGPRLMLAGNKANVGQHKIQVVGQNGRRRRRRTTSNPSSKQFMDLLLAGVFSLAGVGIAELVGNYIASPMWRIAGKAGAGLLIGIGGQHIPIKFVKENAAFAGAGAVGSAGADALAVFRSRGALANMFLRPVRLMPNESALPPGAVLPADVIKAAQNGNVAAQRLLIEVQPYAGSVAGLADIVWLPATPGLNDIVYKQNIASRKAA